MYDNRKQGWNTFTISLQCFSCNLLLSFKVKPVQATCKQQRTEEPHITTTSTNNKHKTKQGWKTKVLLFVTLLNQANAELAEQKKKDTAKQISSQRKQEKYCLYVEEEKGQNE
jgi:hypothetical protein